MCGESSSASAGRRNLLLETSTGSATKEPAVIRDQVRCRSSSGGQRAIADLDGHLTRRPRHRTRRADRQDGRLADQLILRSARRFAPRCPSSNGLAEVIEVGRVNDDVVIVLARETEQVRQGRTCASSEPAYGYQRDHALVSSRKVRSGGAAMIEAHS